MPRSRGKKNSKSKRQAQKPPSAPLPTLQWFIDHGGHIDVGAIPPLECVAIAADEHAMYVALQRQAGESILDLLARLDSSLDYCFENDEFVDEINAPSSSTR